MPGPGGEATPGADTVRALLTRYASPHPANGICVCVSPRAAECLASTRAANAIEPTTGAGLSHLLHEVCHCCVASLSF